MFTIRQGDCYNYAAAFCHLGRALGADVRAVSGYTGHGEPHSFALLE